MNNKFFDAAKEKQDRIINAALQVFAVNGYRHASTDEIVRIAGISKGLLFHYFGSKLGLYSFLYDYSTKFMRLELSRDTEGIQTDYFTLKRGVETARMRVYRKYPYMRRFLDGAEREDCEEAMEAVEALRMEYGEWMRALMERADYRVLERKADLVRAVKAIDYTLEGVTEEYSLRPDYTPEGLYEEIMACLDMFERLLAPDEAGKRAEEKMEEQAEQPG